MNVNDWTYDQANGQKNGLYMSGILVFTMVIIVANIKILLISSHNYRFLGETVNGLSVISYFVIVFAISSILNFPGFVDNFYYGAFWKLYGNL